MVPISRSCHGCAATDLLERDERILSFNLGTRFFSPLAFSSVLMTKPEAEIKQNHNLKTYKYTKNRLATDFFGDSRSVKLYPEGIKDS